jgi:multidrug resistance efflux pump
MKKTKLILLLVPFFIFACSPSVKTGKYTSQTILHGSFNKVVEVKGVIRPGTEETVSIPPDVWGTLEKLVPEGTKVKKGDFVAKVNVREMLENYNNFSERMAGSKFDADKQKADLPVEMLKLDEELNRKKNELINKSIDYQLVKKGSTDDLKTKADIDIEIPRLKIKNHSLPKKQELFKKGYLSRQEIDNSELEYNGLESDLQKAEISKYQLTPGYRKPDFDKARLTEDQAKLDVQINTIENQAQKSSLVVKARNNEFKVNHFMNRLNRFKKTIKMANIYAPISGIVIYPKIWGWQKPFVGMEVWDRFTFMDIAETDKLKIETKINEQEIVNIKTGQKVEIRLSSLPARVFEGKVAKISKLAKYLDERNPEGLKYFDVDITVTKQPEVLKTNMNADLKIICSSQENSFYIPAEALIEEGKNFYVYFDENNGPVKKAVKIKERNNDFVLLSGQLTGNEKFYIINDKEI